MEGLFADARHAAAYYGECHSIAIYRALLFVDALTSFNDVPIRHLDSAMNIYQ